MDQGAGEGDLLQHALGKAAAALAGIAWLMWVKAGQLGEYGETTAQLKMGLAPFVHAMSVLCAVTALVHLLLIARRWVVWGEWDRIEGFDPQAL